MAQATTSKKQVDICRVCSESFLSSKNKGSTDHPDYTATLDDILGWSHKTTCCTTDNNTGNSSGPGRTEVPQFETNHISAARSQL